MDSLTSNMARDIALAASAFQYQSSGHKPQSVNVVLCDDTLVITLHGALSKAEIILAQTAAGAAKVQEFHRQLFAASSGALGQEIKRITGIDVQEAAAEVEPIPASVVHAFTTGTMVQVFHLALRLPEAIHGAIVEPVA
jgi:uncharacterized protein YbcI